MTSEATTAPLLTDRDKFLQEHGAASHLVDAVNFAIGMVKADRPDVAKVLEEATAEHVKSRCWEIF